MAEDTVIRMPIGDLFQQQNTSKISNLSTAIFPDIVWTLFNMYRSNLTVP